MNRLNEEGDFQYDAFISYASVDREWARKLAEALETRGLKVFWDQDGLRLGEEWVPQLSDALAGAHHLVLLASPAAGESSWVDEELYRFRRHMDDERDRGESRGRTVLPVLLEGKFARLPLVHGLDVLAERGAYAAGADAVADDVWRGVVRKVHDGIVHSDDALAVPVLLLTSTRPRMESKVDVDEPPVGGGAPLAEVLTALGIGANQLFERYGDSRRDWRPFGSERPVRLILDDLKDSLNAQLVAAERPRLSWRYLDEQRFWDGGPEAVAAEAALLESEPALIVADPLAFYDELVRSRYSQYLQPGFTDAHTFILVLAPFALPPQAAAVRQAIASLARQVFLHYYEPPVFAGNKFARCGANIADEMDFKSWLITTVGTYPARTRPRRAAPLRMASE